MFHTDLTPKQAAAMLNDLITIRIFANSKWLTFFYVRDNQAGLEYDSALGCVTINIVPDASAHAPSHRVCPPASSDGVILDCEGVAESKDFVMQSEFALEGDDDVITARLTSNRYSLVHDMAIRFVRRFV
jgi:hypothetical protein